MTVPTDSQISSAVGSTRLAIRSLHVRRCLKRRHRGCWRLRGAGGADKKDEWREPRVSHGRASYPTKPALTLTKPQSPPDRGGRRTTVRGRAPASCVRRRGSILRRSGRIANRDRRPDAAAEPGAKAAGAERARSRASLAMAIVSGIWLPSSVSASRCESADNSPSAARLASRKAVAASGPRAVSRTK